MSQMPLLSDVQVVGWWFLVGALCATWVASDLSLTNHRVDRPLRAVWPALVLVWSLPGLLLYLAVSRPVALQDLDATAVAAHRHRFAARRWRRVVGATLVTTGSAGGGFIAALAVLRLAGAPVWAQVGAGFTVAFVASAGLGQEALLRRRSRSAAATWARATFAGVLAVLLGGAGAALLLAPRAAIAAAPVQPAFWSLAVAAVTAGCLVALPVHWLLVRRRWAEGAA